MRLTPAQIGMLRLLNTYLPPLDAHGPRELTAKDRIKEGRDSLVQITKTDFGYDPEDWHEYLRKTNDGGYRWSNKHLGMPKKISHALADPEWQAAVKELIRNT